MPHAPQPLLLWPSDGVYRTEEDAFVAAEDTIYYIQEKNCGRALRTLGPYHALDRLKTGCAHILHTRCLGITLSRIHEYLEPLAFWQLVDFAIAPTPLFLETAMPYDIITQPNKDMAAALRKISGTQFLPIFVVRVAKADPPFIQKREDIDARLPGLVKDESIWSMSTVHLDWSSANEQALRLFSHLCHELHGTSWLDFTGKVAGERLFAGVALGVDGEVRVIVHVRAQYAP